MPNFSLRIATAVAVTVWDDPATPSAPSRLNPVPRYPHRYHAVAVGGAIELRATVGGVDGPADGALGGKLFKWSWVEQPSGAHSVPIPATAGFTSVTTFPAGHFLGHLGHYTILCWREDGGAVLLPFEVTT